MEGAARDRRLGSAPQTIGPKTRNTKRMAIETRTTRAEQAVSISAASRITQVETHTLRYWEKEFHPYLNPTRTEGGQRRYRPQDLETVFTIKRLLRDEMFSIAGAKKFLARRLEEWAA